MKFAMIALSLLSITTFSADVVELSQEDCTRKCELYSYNFQADAFGLCQQVEKCDIFSWDKETEVCEVVKKDELVSYPIACRDIPAY
jgi:hypothetical protein